jgi:hypothetical protein
MDDVFILAGTHTLSGAFGWLLCSVAARARQERLRAQREAVQTWAENAQKEAELDRYANPNRYPLDHPGYTRLGIELGLVCPPDASALVAEQNRKAARSVDIDLTDGAS